MKKIVTRRFDENLSGYSEPKYVLALKNKNKTNVKNFQKSCEIIVRKKSSFLVIYCKTISSDKSH